MFILALQPPRRHDAHSFDEAHSVTPCHVFYFLEVALIELACDLNHVATLDAAR
jgi:hypothetical protein